MIFIFPFFLGHFLLLTPKIPSDKINVTIIQPNIHLKEKWGRGPIQNIEHNIAVSNIFLNDSTELLIWPETAVTTFINVDSKIEIILRDFLQRKRNGKGTYYIKMYNEKYEGDFVEDKRHGKGTYTYSDRSPAKKYVGDFRNEMKHGFGTATYRDGSKYVGEFKNGRFDGEGTLTSKDGVLKGKWEGGNFLE